MPAVQDRAKVKRPETQMTPSKQLFQAVLEYQERPQPLDDQAYCELIKDFFNALLLLHAKHEITDDRQGERIDKDPFIINVILTEALRDSSALSHEEREFIQSIFLNDKFFIILVFTQFWGSGGDSMPLCQHFFNISGMTDEDKLHAVILTSKHLFDMIGSQYYEYGHWGYDLLSILTSLDPNPVNRLHHFNAFYRAQSYIELAMPYFDLKKNDFDMPESIFGKKPSLVSAAKDFAESNLVFIKQLHYMMADVIKERLQNPSISVAQHISTVEAAYHSYAMNDAIEYHQSHYLSLENIIYNDLFSTDSPLRHYDDTLLENFFYHLLYSLYSVTEGLSNTAIKNDLADTYAGSDMMMFNDIRKTRMLESLRESYFIMLGLASRSTNLKESAEQLTVRYKDHLVKVRQLEENEPINSDSVSYTSYESYDAACNKLRHVFFENLLEQKQINDDVYKKLYIYRRFIMQAHADIALFNNDYSSFLDTKEGLEVITPNIENKRLRVRLSELSKKMALLKQDTALKPQEVCDELEKLTPVSVLFEDFLKSLTHELEVDVRYRLYLDALHLENARLKKFMVKVDFDESLTHESRIQKIQQEKQSYELKINDLKKSYNIHPEALLQLKSSLPIIDSELEFNDQCELNVPLDREATLGMVATRLMDIENKRRWAHTSRENCLRLHSHHQLAGEQLAARQDIHADDIAYKRIIARYDPSVKANLQRKQKEAHKVSSLRHRRNKRYAAFTLMAVIGVAGLAAATVSTLGLIHLTWILPTVYFAAGGSATTAGMLGLIFNKPSYYQSLKRATHKSIESISSILRSVFRIKTASVDTPQLAQVSQQTVIQDDWPSPSITVRQTSLRNRRNHKADVSRYTREEGDVPILPVDPEFKPHGAGRDVISQSKRARKLKAHLYQTKAIDPSKPEERKAVFKALREFYSTSSIWKQSSTTPSSMPDDDSVTTPSL